MQKLEVGYKGKGMCKNCGYSDTIKTASGTPALRCEYYGSWCKLVSRNCSGIRILITPNIKPSQP